MSFHPDFVASLDDEVRAFINIVGIELRENVHGSFTPIIRREGFD